MILSLVAAAAIANLSLVIYLADRFTPETGEAASGGLDAVEGGLAFAARLTA